MGESSITWDGTNISIGESDLRVVDPIQYWVEELQNG